MRLPWTIWLHILSEMWRLLLLTTAVLVTVTAFAVTVRYTAEGKLGPFDTLKYMTLAMVPMLQYVLPFAAGFGATLAYHRMTQDNDLTAAKASGVSHRALLVPALLTGLVLAGVLGVLNGNVIPRFLRSLDGMIAQLPAGMIASKVDAGQPIEMGRRIVYADQVYRLAPDPSEPGGPSQMLLLTGVVALEVGPKGEVVGEATAAQALIAFFASSDDDAVDPENPRRSAGGITMVSLELKNAKAYGELKRVQAGSQAVVYPIRGVFNDDPKYYTNRELAAIPADPDQINVIDTRRRELAYHLAERDTMADVQASLASQGQARMTDLTGRTFSIRASGIRWEKPRWELIPPGGADSARPIEVDMYRAGPGGQPDPSDRVHLAAKTAGLRSELTKDPATRKLTLMLELEEVAASAREGEPATQRARLPYGGLIPKDNPLAELIGMKSADLLSEAARRTAAKPEAAIDSSARDLRQRIMKLSREVFSKQHERAAMSVACLVMVLAGALTAMRLADSLPLTVYLWSFFPALAAVITVSAGQNITHRMGPAGLLLLWGGVAGLAAYATSAFWLVRKH